MLLLGDCGSIASVLLMEGMTLLSSLSHTVSIQTGRPRAVKVEAESKRGELPSYGFFSARAARKRVVKGVCCSLELSGDWCHHRLFLCSWHWLEISW